MITKDMVELAKAMAHVAHAGQIRKYTGEPYAVHPCEVALIIRTLCFGLVESDLNAMLCAAYLHDVLEDTHVTKETIINLFGEQVAEIVDGLTDKSTKKDGNRETRKRIDRERLAKCCWAVQTIKCADLISNTRSIVAHDSKFARTYLAEKELLLEVMTEADPVLYEAAWRSLKESKKELEMEETVE